MKIIESSYLVFNYIFNLKYIKLVSRQPPIVICGCGRSGTTLLLSILGSHPKIQAIPIETAVFLRNNLKSFTERKIQLHLSKYLLRNRKIGAHRWVEKTPLNIHFIPEIISYFNGKVKIINIVRDGRDVVTSIHPNYKDHYFISTKRWVEEIQLGLTSDKYEQLYTIKYEDLILNFDNTIKNLMEFIDEDYCDQLKTFDRHTNVKENVAWNHKVRPVHSESLNKWKKKEHELRIKDFYKNKQAIKLLKKLGYQL